MYTQNDIHKISTASPLVYNNMGVTRGRLPQRAGSLGLNGGGASAAVPPTNEDRPVLSATTLQACPLEQFLACFRVARVCRRQLGFLANRRKGSL